MELSNTPQTTPPTPRRRGRLRPGLRRLDQKENDDTTRTDNDMDPHFDQPSDYINESCEGRDQDSVRQLGQSENDTGTNTGPLIQPNNRVNVEVTNCNFSRLPTVGDGSCFFRAISIFFHDNQDHHIELRKKNHPAHLSTLD